MEEKIRSFTDLKAWQKGHQLVLAIYRISDKFPSRENFSLTDQIRRAAVSITSNLAEGFSRYGKKEKQQFYRMALGSLTELQNQLLIAKDLNYCTQEDFKKLADESVELGKMINGLIRSLNTNY